MTLGVVVMAYGTPASPDDVEAYYTHIRRGRPPSDEQLADLRRRYDALGGTSSMAARTAAQVDAIAAALEERAPGRFRVVLGQKHAAPFVEDAARSLVDEGVTDVVGLVLAPHYSGFSVGEYLRRLEEAMTDTRGQTPSVVRHTGSDPVCRAGISGGGSGPAGA